MDPRWLDAAGRISLYLFFGLVGALVGALGTMSLCGRALRSQRDTEPSFSPTRRLFTEYVGNVDWRFDADRRQLWQVRALVDEIHLELRQRGVPVRDRQEFMNRLRETIRFEQHLYELGRRDLPTQVAALHTRRVGLADAFGALLADPPPEIVARIRNGFLPTLEPSGHEGGTDDPR